MRAQKTNSMSCSCVGCVGVTVLASDASLPPVTEPEPLVCRKQDYDIVDIRLASIENARLHLPQERAKLEARFAKFRSVLDTMEGSALKAFDTHATRVNKVLNADEVSLVVRREQLLSMEKGHCDTGSIACVDSGSRRSYLDVNLAFLGLDAVERLMDICCKHTNVFVPSRPDIWGADTDLDLISTSLLELNTAAFGITKDVEIASKKLKQRAYKQSESLAAFPLFKGIQSVDGHGYVWLLEKLVMFSTAIDPTGKMVAESVEKFGYDESDCHIWISVVSDRVRTPIAKINLRDHDTLKRSPKALAFGRNGNILAVMRSKFKVLEVSTYGGIVAVYNLEEFGENPSGIVANHTHIVVGTTGGAVVFSYDALFVPVVLKNGTSPNWSPKSVALSPDGRLVAVSDPWGSAVMLFSISGQLLERCAMGKNTPYHVEFLASGHVAVNLGIQASSGNCLISIMSPLLEITDKYVTTPFSTDVCCLRRVGSNKLAVLFTIWKAFLGFRQNRMNDVNLETTTIDHQNQNKNNGSETKTKEEGFLKLFSKKQ